MGTNFNFDYSPIRESSLLQDSFIAKNNFDFFVVPLRELHQIPNSSTPF